MSLQESNLRSPSIIPVARAVAQTGRTTGEPPAQTGSDLPDTESQSGSDSWFQRACRDILGKDAGLHLHHITGYPERSCYRYASGEREPPSDFLRKLFHSDHGEPFHAAFMDDCKAPWWIDRGRQLRNARKVEALKLE